MREDEIVKALQFVRSDKVKDVPFDDRVQFLNEKLSAEEI